MDAAIVAGRTEIGLEQTGTTVQVPTAPLAKLMFYLKCMCQVLNLEQNGNIARLTNYNQHYLLTSSEIDDLLILCLLLSPDELNGKCIFEDEALCGDSQNQFYELSAVQNRFVLTGSMFIGNQQRQVKKIMVYKPIFLLDNYIHPIVYFQDRLRVLSARLSGQTERQPISYQNTSSAVVVTQPSRQDIYVPVTSEKWHEKTCLNLCLTVFCPVWIFIWCCMCMCDV